MTGAARRILVMAGGTGGHVYPALAVARALRERGHGVSWLGTPGGLEARLVPAAGFHLDTIRIAGLRGNGLLGWLAAPVRVVRAVLQAVAAFHRRRPHVVLGMGGFASGPGGLAAWLTRRPLVIHEQNAAPGLTNRLLARWASRVLVAFPGTFPEGVDVTVTGNPVRDEIAALEDPAARYAGREGAPRLLVFGGSQGARALNEMVPAALAGLPPERRPQVCHQTGAPDLEATRERYRSLEVEAEVVPYLEEIVEAYAWADLVVSRAGALTVSELAAAGLPAVLVPYPHAVDDHQTRNARYLADAGAALLLPQDEMTPAVLAERLGGLLQGGRGRLREMAEAARRQARPEATEQVVDHCLALAGVDDAEVRP